MKRSKRQKGNKVTSPNEIGSRLIDPRAATRNTYAERFRPLAQFLYVSVFSKFLRPLFLLQAHAHAHIISMINIEFRLRCERESNLTKGCDGVIFFHSEETLLLSREYPVLPHPRTLKQEHTLHRRLKALIAEIQGLRLPSSHAFRSFSEIKITFSLKAFFSFKKKSFLWLGRSVGRTKRTLRFIVSHSPLTARMWSTARNIADGDVIIVWMVSTLLSASSLSLRLTSVIQYRLEIL